MYNIGSIKTEKKLNFQSFLPIAQLKSAKGPQSSEDRFQTIAKMNITDENKTITDENAMKRKRMELGE